MLDWSHGSKAVPFVILFLCMFLVFLGISSEGVTTRTGYGGRERNSHSPHNPGTDHWGKVTFEERSSSLQCFSATGNICCNKVTCLWDLHVCMRCGLLGDSKSGYADIADEPPQGLLRHTLLHLLFLPARLYLLFCVSHPIGLLVPHSSCLPEL